jgi:AcrR family transcriptional regulator
MVYRRTPDTAARQAAARERILDAATARVTRGGYAAATVEAVASDAGVATGTVYRHFGCKADLLAEVFRATARRELAAAKAAADRVSTGGAPVWERLDAVVTTFAERALRSGRLAWALVAEPVDPAVETERLLYRRAYVEFFTGMVEGGIKRGEIPHQQAGITAAALVGAIGEAVTIELSHSHHGPREPDSRFVRGLVAVCVRALGEVPRSK